MRLWSRQLARDRHRRAMTAATRIQTFWRTKQGQFAAHLKRRAMWERRRMEDEAATEIQRLVRGMLGRQEKESGFCV